MGKVTQKKRKRKWKQNILTVLFIFGLAVSLGMLILSEFITIPFWIILTVVFVGAGTAIISALVGGAAR